MIQSEFDDGEGSESISFSHRQLGLVVQALDDAAGELLSGSEIIEDQFSMAEQGLGDFLHRFDARTHNLLAPIIEEFSGPGR